MSSKAWAKGVLWSQRWSGHPATGTLLLEGNRGRLRVLEEERGRGSGPEDGSAL